MWKQGRFALLVVVALTGCFVAGLYALFVSRFETGDVYPVYSSLRSDPLGAKALYQALERTPGISVNRHYRETRRLEDAGNKVLLILGLAPDFLTSTPADMASEMDAVAQSGARLVLAFQPTRTLAKETPRKSKTGDASKEPAPDGSTEGEKQKKEETTGKGDKTSEYKPLSKRWEISPTRRPLPGSPDGAGARASLKAPLEGLPAGIPLRSGLWFENAGPPWRVLYSVGEKPAIVERSLGKGSVVLVADAYLFSNEALRDERHSALLAWFIGPKSSVVFDEYHLGVMEQPGLMTFARKYRLHGFIAVLALIGVLLVWQRSAPGAPVPAADTPEELEGAGKDHLSGLIHLLRRNIPREDVLKICYDEWRQSAGRETVRMRERMSRVEEILEAESRKSAGKQDIAHVYGKVAEILSRRGQIK